MTATRIIDATFVSIPLLVLYITMSQTTKGSPTTPNGKRLSVLAESNGLLFNSIFIYAFPDLHALAHKKLLQEGDADRVAKYPIKVVDLIDVVMKNRKALEAHMDATDAKLYGSALFLLKEEIEKMPEGKEALMNSEIVFFDDKNSNSELVFCISKSDLLKRVIISFRGSATLKDLAIDADGKIIEFDNPINADSKEKLGVHQGFHAYLNNVPKGKHGGKNLKEVNKYSEIMSELRVIYEKCPDYCLFVTGHSLGASLAQLFAMEVAAGKDEFIPKPVTTINFASPKVGDIYFRNCFEDLEDQGLLRCLRFRNDKDIIPTLPDRQNCSCLRNIRCQPSVYRHAGPSVLLYPGGDFEVHYEKRDKETMWKFVEEAKVTRTHGVGFAAMVPTLLRYGKNFLTYHSCLEYLNRFSKFAVKGADKLYLDDIYKNEAAITKLLENGFKQS